MALCFVEKLLSFFLLPSRQSISSRTANTTPLQPGMIVSNEPGYYPGNFGVRIENLLEIVNAGISNEALGRRYVFYCMTRYIRSRHKLLS